MRAILLATCEWRMPSDRWGAKSFHGRAWKGQTEKGTKKASSRVKKGRDSENMQRKIIYSSKNWSSCESERRMQCVTITIVRNVFLRFPLEYYYTTVLHCLKTCSVSKWNKNSWLRFLNNASLAIAVIASVFSLISLHCNLEWATNWQKWFFIHSAMRFFASEERFQVRIKTTSMNNKKNYVSEIVLAIYNGIICARQVKSKCRLNARLNAVSFSIIIATWSGLSSLCLIDNHRAISVFQNHLISMSLLHLYTEG